MNYPAESPRELLEDYARALRDYSQSSTEEETSDAIIDLRELTGEMELQSAEVAEALHVLLEQATHCCNNKQT